MACRRLACFVAALLLLAAAVAEAKEYAAIFNFGDSLVDAGNLVVDGIPDYLATGRLPYGMTYFGYPTGRCSDGRLVVDFIAQELGLPLLPPSKAKNATFHRGANFAITGATSLDTPFFCRELFRRSLFIVGEFGGNDYNSPLFAFRPLSEAHDFIPHVVDSIAEGVEKLIAEGAVELVVPGVLPIGCFPVYLSIFRKQPEMYGAKTGCIRDLNTLSWVHNAALQRKIVELRAKHPDVRIIYADYYTPAIQFVLHAEKYGQYSILPGLMAHDDPGRFSISEFLDRLMIRLNFVLGGRPANGPVRLVTAVCVQGFLKQTPRACCGAPGVGEYNFNLTSKCGEPGAYSCDDPSNHWSWDGIHLTEASYGHIAKGWLYGPFADPPILDNKHLG
ncbi:hypothetical protein HU200_027763 [Digitaria exilis]|uniref:GDSL esterase/lipase n=1 Tax=Digitaria exilis TaxID=1010633 RepID=A0A835BW15_9POAL|nr:hypothetical protein HU200_027763 [Digitaria exilis]